MRIVKEHEERRTEILNTAQTLFATKGYTKTTINDILQAIGIAKGTFYHYFKSKEEVLDAIIERIIQADVAKAQHIASDSTLSAMEKIFAILLAQAPQQDPYKEQLIEHFHQPDNAEMHQKSLVQAIVHLSPILTEVIEQGIEENIFHTNYPQETVEFLLVSAQVIFDDGFFQWQPEEMLQRATAFVQLIERALGAKEGSFQKMLDILLK
ncbi:TetR/AcrR family transcriptional regulator [Lysinibacillus louembei]|uniref:TetR/AcrR family transcriptional regulator n=1 Tax=Lysinibacillus louembei TaxID=1470088 RepID=A0ABZ0RVN4_9BACI|nr:TetR/AcrR family transcriptional regulator [Lysinibacillus louembei]WPK10910.1 TetR/AcrR family transcriptional regulator [Lysinibacillus louembei]